MIEVHSKIITLRNHIRYPRDQKGDDRCWVDYFPAYLELPDTVKERFTTLPSYEECMRICTSFYHNRRADQADSTPKDAILNPKKWDKDITRMINHQLSTELDKIERAIRKHRDTPILELTLDDDRELYRVLPEKIPVDARLPPEHEFLGTSRKGAGCPSFWRSHRDCKTCEHNLKSWGPCKKK